MSSSPCPIVIYTDGACSGNPGPGGWAYLVSSPTRQEQSGHVAHTTNNRMELLAVIKALESFQNPMNITIYTDSVYVQKGITIWILGWKKRNWKNSQGKEVKNKDLWLQLDHLCQLHNTKFHWVKGHHTSEENNIVDQLAQQASKQVEIR